MGEHFLPGCCVPVRLRVLRELRNCALALLVGLIFMAAVIW